MLSALGRKALGVEAPESTKNSKVNRTGSPEHAIEIRASRPA
jgi:hypothetical protein